MTKEEILTASRKENKNRDMVEVECLKQACKMAYIVGRLTCVLVCVLQWVLTRTTNWSCWFVNFATSGTVFLVEAIKLKTRHELFMALLDYGLCIFLIIEFVLSLRG